jgi:NAD(P)-dependent dehydrogenase (short-subunit alcohol dehydrogenase family)
VVGGGSGIGRAVVEAFLLEGASVAVLEHDPQKCRALNSEGIVVMEGDATRLADNLKAVAVAASASGALDVLVNCVGVFDFYRGVDQLDGEAIDAAFDEVFRTNVKSHLLSVKAALPALRRSANAVVLLTESTSAYYPGRGGVLYIASKFAVRGLVTALAHDLAPSIRVNGVAPGGTLATDLRGVASLGAADRRIADTPGRAEELAARVPLGVALSPADHAGSYVFLASDRARGITGDVIHSDGGIRIAGRA